mgnify:CR=1 FL=1
MNQPTTIQFQGQEYFDDRLFVLYLCKGTVEIEPDDEGVVWTKIYHENAPNNHIWCVATYRNCNRYPLFRVDSFYKKGDAIAYIRKIEPETPLISLGGVPSASPLSYEEYLSWKSKNNFKEYDWKSLYSLDGTNASESIGQTKEQFKGIM